MTIINLLNIKQKKSNPIFDMKGNNVTDVFYDDKCSICFKNLKPKPYLKNLPILNYKKLKLLLIIRSVTN